VASRRPRGAGRPPPRSQHFLRSDALAAEIVREAGIGPRDLVVEIGAGRGRLTEQLARVADRVVAVEVDADLARSLSGRWDNVQVVVADATETSLPEEPFRVVANLPFHRTTDVLRLLLEPGGSLTRADLIVEWDVAVKRAVPWPSTLNGVYWSAFFELSLARRLPRSVFVPQPAVDAGVLVLRRRCPPLVPAADADRFRRFVAHGFRKGLGSVNARSARDGARMKGRIARDLDAHEWASLFCAHSR
jgi:16S rRNA A1518/A1519 N6-dimethyltransferase RsmA/KsgA/DIM1 with predicted DNA glycosylase/AP lyase activity